MNLHDNEACKQKCDCVMKMLSEIQEILENPRSDREQSIKCTIEIALQDLAYLSNEIDDRAPL